MDIEKLGRVMAASQGIRFGTSVPFAMGSMVRMRRIGFADLPMAELTVTAAPQHTSALVPIVRQYLYRTLEANGIPSDAVAYSPSVGTASRASLFVDTNPSSASHGKRKRGNVMTFHFEFTDRSWFNPGQSLRIPTDPSATD